MLPDSCRVIYNMYLTSKAADATYVLTTPILSGHLSDHHLEMYRETRLEDVFRILNTELGVSDFREMTKKETDLFVRGFHKHSIAPVGMDPNQGYKH